ncbi:MAG: Holliday junction branch migration protein RuvA, partial [Clostridia bacterium]
MYYYIKGTVAHIEPGLAVIDAGGVGYACHTSHATAGRIEINTKATLYTYLHVREDIMDLYGFADTEELACFKMLIGISGVGPKAALAILSAVAPNELALAIVTGDEKPFLAAPGVGKKLAARIILELKDKVAKEQIALADAGLATPIP